MSTDSKGHRYCDGSMCARTIVRKAQRVLVRHGRSLEFCPACYKREFTRVTCAACATKYRRHRDGDDDIGCPTCSRARRTCLRCGRPAPSAGKMIGGKPVCPSCASYYHAEGTCTQCGRTSRRLSTLPKYGVHMPICERCQQRVNHKTCGRCGRYRRVAGEQDGRPLCPSCLPGQTVSHACPQCGAAIAGDGAGRCPDCLGRSRLALLQESIEPKLTTAWGRELLRRFTEWYGTSRVSVAAVRRYPRHLPFFQRLETLGDGLAAVTPAVLLGAFPVKVLRRHLTAVHFLREACGIVLPEADKKGCVERGRIAGMMAAARGRPGEGLLAAYLVSLGASSLPVRTQRQYLRAADGFLRFHGAPVAGTYGDAHVAAYLRRHRSRRANLFRFVTFLRAQGHPITAVPAKRRLTRPPRLVTAVAGLLKRVQRLADEVTADDIARVLGPVLGFTYGDFSGRKWTVAGEEQKELVSGDTRVAIPESLRPLVLAWEKRRNDLPRNDLGDPHGHHRHHHGAS